MLPDNIQKTYVIWSAFPNFDDWKDGILCEEPELTEDQAYERMLEVNGEYLDDERANLGGIRYNEPILVIALLGLWNGKCEGYAQVRSGKVADCLYSRYDPEWYVTSDGEFMCADHHHDGTNYYWYRVWKKDVDEDQRDDLMDKIYCHTATSEEILALTNPIGPEIAKVYGWTITPLQATA